MATALYRRYRPESFADVIGQEHVTAPLMQALRSDRTNHAYLFSGPRGCGKTTSARILARCLNCAEGPTDTPCGVCDSCRDLSRDGGGSLDVVEIDAASHGGVDDARELRERAAIAPARDRFKIFIVDEAHMVTNQGFNAMLKLVEEPPAHVKFVFATTEPDKVLPTIRSRTHHYPFHLVAPGVLSEYLTTLCETENVPVGPGVIPLVVRAGGGSVRDSLSVLDQLMAGADESGLDQARAAALLGFTEGPLLDDVMNALAAVDGAAMFGVVDRVLSTGQDPRRFVEDLLVRLRDLIVVAALKEQAETVLRGYPQDQLERLAGQASNFRPAELSRDADVVNDALADMVGASSPRIQLELLCARLLLPAVDGQEGHGARLDRLERVMSSGVPAGSVAPAVRPAQPVAQNVSEGRPPVAPPSTGAQPETPAARQEPPAQPTPTDASPTDAPSTDAAATGEPSFQAREAEAHPEPPTAGEAPGARASSVAPETEPPTAGRPQVSAGEDSPAAGDSQPGGDNTELLRRFWPDIMNAVRKSSRATWSIVNEQAQVLSCAGGKVTLGIANPGALRMFMGRATHADNLARAVQEQTNLVVQVEAVPFERGSAEDASFGAARSVPETASPRASQAPAAERPGEADASPSQAMGAQPTPTGPPANSEPRSEAPRSEAPRPESHGPEARRSESPEAQSFSAARNEPAPPEPAGWGDEPPADEPPFPDPMDQGPPAALAGPDRSATGPAEPTLRSQVPAPEHSSADASSTGGPAATDAKERQYTPSTATQEPQEEPPGWGDEPAAAPASSDGDNADQPGPVAVATGPEQEMPQPVPTTPGRPSRAEQMAQAARRRFNESQSGPEPEDVISADDPDAEEAGMVGRAVVERVLGGKVIDDLG